MKLLERCFSNDIVEKSMTPFSVFFFFWIFDNMLTSEHLHPSHFMLKNCRHFNRVLLLSPWILNQNIKSVIVIVLIDFYIKFSRFIMKSYNTDPIFLSPNTNRSNYICWYIIKAKCRVGHKCCVYVCLKYFSLKRSFGRLIMFSVLSCFMVSYIIKTMRVDKRFVIPIHILFQK